MDNKKKCLLIYYSGTGNTKYITDKLEPRLSEFFDVEVYRINPLKMEQLDLKKYDLIGISYPIYGLNLPSKVHKFFKKQKFEKGQRVFIYKNSGETWRENNSSSLVLRKIITPQRQIHLKFRKWIRKRKTQLFLLWKWNARGSGQR